MSATDRMLREKLSAISKIIKDNYIEEPHPGMLSGLSGLALFQFYYAGFVNDDEFSDTGLEILTRCIDKINEGYNFPTYCTGIAGMGWLLEHLKEHDFIEIGAEDRLTELDEYLYAVMVDAFTGKEYDFLHGGIGYGWYFLKRYKNATSKTLKQRYRNYLLESVTLLNKVAEADGDAIKWVSVAKDSKEERYNLGLSHGIPSIVNYLAGLYVYEDFKNETETMLRRGVRYILNFLSDDLSDFSLFPNWVKKGETQNPKQKSRLAWCYGDPGVGLSLWKASKALNDQTLANTAITILKHAANRTSPEDSMVVDAGVCHGSYGNAQLFNRMYKETGIPEFKTATLFWIEDGLKKAIHDDGYAGYKQWYGSKKEWLPELSLLEGVCGIGLTILSYLAPDDMMHWDECLMMS